MLPSRAHPPSGAQYHIANGRLSAVATEVGASLRGLWSADRPILDGYPEDAMCTGSRGMPLLPWPNRIEDGRYAFGGQEHQLPIDRPDERTALHGLTRWLPWRRVAHDSTRVVLGLELAPRPGYPFSLGLSVEYALSRTGLSVAVSATNNGTSALPFGAGHHPYFAPRGGLEEARVRVRARRCFVQGDRGLPGDELDAAGTEADLREYRPIGGMRLAHTYGDLDRDADGRARVEFDDLVVWMDRAFPWVLLYTGDEFPDPTERRRSLAIEPMTCPANAFRTGRDVIVLQPGETTSLRWGIDVG